MLYVLYGLAAEKVKRRGRKIGPQLRCFTCSSEQHEHPLLSLGVFVASQMVQGQIIL